MQVLSCGQPAIVQATYNVKKRDFISWKPEAALPPRIPSRCAFRGAVVKRSCEDCPCRSKRRFKRGGSFVQSLVADVTITFNISVAT